MRDWVKAWILSLALPLAGWGEGMYADFSTSMGEFSVRLDVERAPRAVAGFVGLATGESAWLDTETNLWFRPFYNGSIFHRVVKDGEGGGMAIQGGGQASRSVNTNNGVVTTNFIGPGYQMLEMVTNGLAHSNGVISMANSGPNTDGSQFFITAAPVPAWDGAYSIFGHVVSGMPVVEAIAAVPVQGSGSRPVEDVHLHQVSIRREGPAAEAFDIHGQDIPVPEPAPMNIYGLGDALGLEIELATHTRPLLFSESADVQEWIRAEMIPGLTYYTGSTQILTNVIPYSEMGGRYFFHTSRIRYPVPRTPPANQRGKLFTFYWDVEPPIKYEVYFSTNFPYQGTFRVTTTNEVTGMTFGGDTWSREIYSGRLVFMDGTGMYGRDYFYSLGFNPGQITNRFTCTIREWINLNEFQILNVSGVFTME